MLDLDLWFRQQLWLQLWKGPGGGLHILVDWRDRSSRPADDHGTRGSHGPRGPIWGFLHIPAKTPILGLFAAAN
jgi:hypothetical protein